MFTGQLTRTLNSLSRFKLLHATLKAIRFWFTSSVPYAVNVIWRRFFCTSCYVRTFVFGFFLTCFTCSQGFLGGGSLCTEVYHYLLACSFCFALDTSLLHTVEIFEPVCRIAPTQCAIVYVFLSQAAIAAHLMCDPFYSGRQQSLELLSLIVTLVAYHLGILLKGGGDGSRSDGMRIFFSSLQFALNAGVIWRFLSCIFKDMMLVSFVYYKQASRFNILRDIILLR